MRRKSFFEEITDNGALKTGDEVEALRIAGGERCLDRGVGWGIGSGEEGVATGLGFWAEVVKLDVAQDGGLDSRK